MKAADRRRLKERPRFLLTWRTTNDFDWHERAYVRRPKGGYVCPYRLEDLRTGTVLACNFDLRQEVYFATHPWPLRTKLQRLWKTKTP